MTINTDNPIREIRTTSKSWGCYVDMKRDEAKEYGIFTFLNFKKTDEDKDGVLSYEEVMKKREKGIKFNQRLSAILSGIGCAKCFSGIKLNSLSTEAVKKIYGTTPRIAHFSKIVTIIVYLLCAMSLKSSASAMKYENNRYKSIYNEYQQLQLEKTV
ncbi:MAG: hypothetical protein MJ237_00540 [bacterium]|nr:hypothetical protein [bacterium]